MITLLLVFVKLIIAAALGVSAIVFLVLFVRHFKQKKAKLVFLPLSVLFAVSVYLVLNYDTSTKETVNREEAEPAFVSNFGFTPPSSVKEIKVRNHVIADAVGHWMGFTYDSLVLNRILREDMALLAAERGSDAFEEVAIQINDSNTNVTDWPHFAKETTDKIYYKKNFMKHNFSEFYLWLNREDKIK